MRRIIIIALGLLGVIVAAAPASAQYYGYGPGYGGYYGSGPYYRAHPRRLWLWSAPLRRRRRLPDAAA